MIRRPATIILFIIIISVAGPPPLITSATNASASPCLASTPDDFSTQPLNPGFTSVILPGHVAPSVKNHQAKYVAGLASNQMLNLDLVFKIRNYDSFTACLASIQDPASPNFRNFLNASTLAPYIPTPGERASFKSYFENNGFVVEDGASPLVLKLTGTVQQASSVFNVNLDVFSQGKAAFYSPTGDPVLPQNFASVTSGIIGLDNYTHIRASESPCSGPYCPQGIRVGYSLTSLYSAGLNGTGVNVAIVGEAGDPDIQTSMRTFDTQYNLPKVKLTLLFPDGVPTNSSGYSLGWTLENALDVEAVHTVAPGAGIILIYSDPLNPDLFGDIDFVAAHKLASIVSNSWTIGCPFECSDTQVASNSTLTSYDLRLAMDAAQGLTILFASGDEGSRPDRAASFPSDIGTEYPSSDPNVLAVGATDLNLNCGPMTCSGYNGETGAYLSGGGYSGAFPEPAWQYSTIGPTPLVGGRSGRGVPDVSMLGGTAQQFWTYTAFFFGWTPEAGTSLSTQLWAGFLAIAAQGRGGPLGNVDQLIYQLGSGASYATLFHDVVTGSNGDYTANVGWDPVTGWGSPIADNLAREISGPATLTVSYSIVGGGNPPAPVLHYVLDHFPKTFDLTTTPTQVSADIATSWSVTNPITGFTNAERWFSNQQTAANVTGPQTFHFTYQHQYNISLAAGWNLISLPLIPDDGSITSILAHQIATKEVSIVWAYSANNKTWQSFNPQLVPLPVPRAGRVFNPNTLSTMTDGKGYWIYTFSPTSILIDGSVFPLLSAPPSYQLSQGWNLIGYKPQPTVQNETVSQYLLSISGSYDPNNVFVYNNLTGSWTRGGPSTQLLPGEVIWILMTSSATLRP